MVENCDDLSSEFKQGFLLRKLEILEDLGTDIKIITNAYDSYQKRYKVKPGAAAAKKRPNQNRYHYLSFSFLLLYFFLRLCIESSKI